MNTNIHIKDYHDRAILPFDKIVQMIRDKEHFTFARYGDGEFDAMLNNSGANCDGHEYFPTMGEALRRTFLSIIEFPIPDYYVGLHISKRNGPQSVAWMLENGIDPSVHKFAQNAVFHDAVIGKFGEDINSLFDALNSREKVMIVGPNYLRRFNLFRFEMFDISQVNCWQDTNRVHEFFANKFYSGYVILFCSGPPAPVWIHDLWRPDATLIDLGSTLDPFCGNPSRSFHDKVKI